MKEIDARGLACPAPVILTKDVVETDAPDSIVVVVDNKAAGENVSRYLQSQSYQADTVKKGDQFRITGSRGEGPERQVAVVPEPEKDQQKIMVMVTTDRMGSGDDALGLKLMVNFLKTVREMGDDLWRLVFVNAGVKLTIEGAETLDPLKELEAGGLHILVCGTCLDHFQLLEKKQVGQTTNMLDIVMAMQFADKVINL
ncbi:MAG: sulfurtransferase-like selenium metabolism protein YedF [bacterium]